MRLACPAGILLSALLLLLTGGDTVAAGVSQWPCDNNDDGCVADRVYHLPGMVEPLPSPWYSGYLTYAFHNRTIHTHYVLILAEEDGSTSPEQKPLIYWSNGGPGASSLFGLMTEVGPLWWDERSLQTPEFPKTRLPTPSYNPYSWTKLGHLLVFDQPAPVGFSFCEGSDSPNDKDNKRPTKEEEKEELVNCAGLGWTDTLVAESAHLALQAFYAKFATLATNDLYLTGESYAGIYIPTLAREILQSTSSSAPLPLKGFAVGDGCLGKDTSLCQVLNQNDPEEPFFDYWYALFLFRHGQIPESTYQQVLQACYVAAGSPPLLQRTRGVALSEACRSSVEKMLQQKGGVPDYALYDTCIYSGGSFRRQQGLVGKKPQYRSSSLALGGGALNDYPCGGVAVMEGYVNLTVVQQALHIPPTVQFWEADNAKGFDYTYTEPNLMDFYKHVALETNLKVLVYNGDTDPAIPSPATEYWTEHLGLPVQQEWTPYTSDGCRLTGGYVTRYQGQLDFATIRGAGHMVPTMKPAAFHALFAAWLTGEDYPPYVPDCPQPEPGLHPSGRHPKDERSDALPSSSFVRGASSVRE